MTRSSLAPAKRFMVLTRDAFQCRYCGCTPENNPLHVDHVVPVAIGGSDDLENLVTACPSCNRGKGANVLPPHPPDPPNGHEHRLAEVESKMGRQDNKTQVFRIRIGPKELKKAKRAAKREGVSLSSVVRSLLAGWLGEAAK